MKKDDTPQQAHEMLNGETKGIYAVNEKGEYELTRTAGWEPETTALTQALEEIDRLTEDALQRARAGSTSPLEYHMCARRMDLPMLAKTVGKFQWQVRRHFNCGRFNNLGTQQLEAYAAVLDIDVETLIKIPE